MGASHCVNSNFFMRGLNFQLHPWSCSKFVFLDGLLAKGFMIGAQFVNSNFFMRGLEHTSLVQ